jgi:hypothetical protein
MPQRTSAASARVERAGPGERHARPDRLPPSIDQRDRHAMPPRGAGTTASGTPRTDPIRTRRRRTREGRAGTLLRVAEGEALEDLPDDRGIVQRGDQAEAAATLGTRQDIDAERPVHQGSPAPGMRTALHACALWTFGPRRPPWARARVPRGYWLADADGWKPGCLRARLWSPTPTLWSLLPGLHPGGEAA